MTVEISKDDTLVEALKKINDEIDRRRTYGVRREELPTIKKVTRCMWSNASASWFCGHPETRSVCPSASETIRKILAKRAEERDRCWHPRDEKEWEAFLERSREAGEAFEKEKPKCREVVSKVQCPDANEIVITGLDHKTIQKIAPLFNELPLYRGSFEAKTRGEFRLLGVEIPPPIANIPLEELDPETITALVEKSLAETGKLE